MIGSLGKQYSRYRECMMRVDKLLKGIMSIFVSNLASVGLMEVIVSV